MNAISLELLYMVETDQKVTLIGKDAASGHHAAIQVDLRPCAAFWASIDNELQGKTAYAAEGVTVNLEFAVDEAPATKATRS